MISQRFFDQWLRAVAIATPRIAELKKRHAREAINLLSRRFPRRIFTEKLMSHRSLSLGAGHNLQTRSLDSECLGDGKYETSKATPARP